MTLLERAEILRERIRKVKELEAKTNIAKSAGDKAQTLKELREALTNHRQRASLLGLREAGNTWPAGIATKLALERYQSALAKERDPSAPGVEAAYKLLIQAVRPLEAAAKEIVEPLILEARTTLADLDRNAFVAWRAIQTDPRPIDAALAKRDELIKMTKAQWLALSPDDLRVTLRAKAAVVKTADGLMANQMPREVQTFVQHAREGGATVEQFSDAVRAWLESNQQLGRVRVVFK